MADASPTSRGFLSGFVFRRIGPFLGLIVIFGSGILLNGTIFLSLYNQMNVLGRISIIALPAVGMTMVILTAGIDLSVGSMVSLASVLCAMLLMERTWTKAAILTVPVFCLMVGFVSVLLIRRGLFSRSPAGKTVFSRIASVIGGIIVICVIGFWVIRQVGTGFSTLAVVLAVPAVGVLLGCISGMIIAKGKIQPFIVTLGMMSVAVGLAKFIAGKGGQIHPIYYDVANYAAEGTSHVAPRSFDLLSAKISIFGNELFPVAGLFFLMAVLLVHAVLRFLRFGRYVYAIGGNEETARLSGIRVDRIKVLVYGISGGLAALAGVLYCAAYTQGKPDAGATWELDAIAAVVIGGTSLMGGRGSVAGTMVGVLILGYLGNILNLQEVPSEVQDILKGLIILGAVLLQEGIILKWIKRLRRRKR